MKLDQKLLKQLITYNRKTGQVIRVAKISSSGTINECDPFVPKSITPYGYYQLSILGRPYPLHRLIFLYMKGRFPKEDVDHKNGDRLDNKWSNLREVTRHRNLKNVGIRSTNTTGHIGVHLRADTGKFHAYINHKRIKYSLGDFSRFEDAVKVRQQAEKEFKFYKNHGKRKAWKNQSSK